MEKTIKVIEYDMYTGIV